MSFQHSDDDSSAAAGPGAAPALNADGSATAAAARATRPVGLYDLVERPELVVGVAFLGGIVLGRLVRALGR